MIPNRHAITHRQGWREFRYKETVLSDDRSVPNDYTLFRGFGHEATMEVPARPENGAERVI
jgi:hypothetical protein